ncbi:MAG: sulfatase-like hydrolase/transferase, partial [Parafilimonas sp.]
RSDKPNIIFFIADDLGYEIPGYTGWESYTTPILDSLAASGIKFTQCYSHPDGYPSRLAVYTGKYNFRNYTEWGKLPPAEKTIGNMLHDAGYATCFVGKWQCDGGDSRIRSAGYDKYRVFLPFAPSDSGSFEDWKYEYKNPRLYENGNYLPDSQVQDKYSEDMYVSYVNKFIDDNASKPFFIVYAHNLPRNPWAPTPNDPDFLGYNPDTVTSYGDKKYFPEMVAYLDKTIGKITFKILSSHLQNNTLILFIGDNATNKAISSLYQGGTVWGGKNLTNKRGTHNPLFACWKGSISPGQVSNTIIDYTDFLPTLAAVAGIPVPTNYGILDGVSFYDNMLGITGIDRTWSFCHWDNSPSDNKDPVRYVQNRTYKLYDEIGYSRFYDIQTDPEETTPLPNASLTTGQRIIKNLFINVLQQMHN